MKIAFTPDGWRDLSEWTLSYFDFASVAEPASGARFAKNSPVTFGNVLSSAALN